MLPSLTSDTLLDMIKTIIIANATVIQHSSVIHCLTYFSSVFIRYLFVSKLGGYRILKQLSRDDIQKHGLLQATIGRHTQH